MTLRYSLKDVEDRAFTIFMKDSVEYILNHQTGMSPDTLMRYFTELLPMWKTMNSRDKDLYRNVAMQQLDIKPKGRQIFQKILDDILDQAEKSKRL